MRLKDIANLQRDFEVLIIENRLTKKNLCDLVIPFRDKYGLTDRQALMIARKEYSLSYIDKLLSMEIEALREEQKVECSCFREQYGKTVCYGTKEIDPCSCNGDKSKCDFYPEVREKANPMTNGDRINTMSDKEKAEFFTWIQQDAFLIGARMRNMDDAKYPTSSEAWLEWLKQPAEE
jgi:hypothetical protein